MERKGQGALEYLLLIGGAILVAVIVISILVGLGSGGGVEATRAAANALCAKYPTGASCNSLAAVGGADDDNVTGGTCTYMCNFDIVLNRCVAVITAQAGHGGPASPVLGTTC